ncbi:MAG: TVP38/TMEM64 family protein [Lawsonella sp.]
MNEKPEPLSTKQKLLRFWQQLYELFVLFVTEVWKTFKNAGLFKQIITVGVALLFLAIIFVVDTPPLAEVRAASESLGSWFPFAFFILYVFLTLFPIPRTIFTLTSGVLFPPPIAIMVCLSATTISGVLAFWLARHMGRDWVKKHMQHPLVDAINERLERRGWLAVGSLRLIPVVPFSILNYAAALTDVKTVPYALATVVGMIPGTVAVTLMGEAAVNNPSPAMLLVMGCCFTLGIIGLVVDAKLPAETTLY